MWLKKEELFAVRRITKTNKTIPITFKDESEGAYPPEKVGFPAREVNMYGGTVRNHRAYRRAGGGDTNMIPSTEEVIVYEAWIKERRARQA